MALSLGLHIRELVADTATNKCVKHNCGTVCLCGPCHARAIQKIWKEQEYESQNRQNTSRRDS